jgi:hypothetical protein
MVSPQQVSVVEEDLDLREVLGSEDVCLDAPLGRADERWQLDRSVPHLVRALVVDLVVARLRLRDGVVVHLLPHDVAEQLLGDVRDEVLLPLSDEKA